MTELKKAVFLSYASDDADPALRICTALRAAGIEVWFDQSELRGGDAWDSAIRQQIRTCALFVPVISRNTQARGEGYFRLEWKLAVDRSHLIAAQRPFLLPVVIDDTRDTDALVPDRFREVQWTRLADGVTPSVFAESVLRLLSPEPLARGLAQPAACSANAPAGQMGSESEHIASATHQASTSRSKAVWGLIGLFVLGVGYFAVDRFVLAKRAVPASVAAAQATSAVQNTIPQKSIAVLAFTDMSPAKDQEYFSDGMAEEILNALSKVEGLRVAGRTSSFSFKGKSADLKAIGQALGVAQILEGSVRKQGDRVRITAILARANDGFQEWAHEYDGTLTDIFDLQERIAREIAVQLKIVLADTSVRLAPKITGNTAAYLSFVEAQDLISRRVELPRAIDLLTKATTLDPQFVRAWSKLAVANAVAPQYSSVSWKSGWAAGEAAARRAIALDPGSAESYASLGYIYLSQRRYMEMVVTFDRALQLNASDPTALYWAANALASMGRTSAAEVLVDRILKSDPVNPTALMYKSLVLQNKKDAEAATQFAERADALGYRTARIITSYIAAQRGDMVAGAENFSAGWGHVNSAFTARDLAAIFRGAYGDAKARAAALVIVNARLDDQLAPTMLLYVHEPAKAFAAFDQYGSGLSDAFLNFLWQPADWSRHARQHPSFQSFAKRNGMLDYWKKNGWPDLCRPVSMRGPDAFDCVD